MVPVKYEPERWSFISAQAGINEAVPCGSVGNVGCRKPTA